MDDSAATSRNAGRRRKLPPWWRWNLITLAVGLFVLMWTRELTQMAPGTTGVILATIFAAWYLIPSLLTSEKPWPLSIESNLLPRVGVTMRHGGPSRLRFYALACRLAACVALGGALLEASIACLRLPIVGSPFAVTLPVSDYVGRIYYFAHSIVWPIAIPLIASVALFTLAALTSDADDRRRHQR